MSPISMACLSLLSFVLPGVAPTRVVQIPRQPMRVGGDIRPPKKVKDVPPVYPAEAKQAWVQGIVVLEAVITHRAG